MSARYRMGTFCSGVVKRTMQSGEIHHLHMTEPDLFAWSFTVQGRFITIRLDCGLW